MKRFTAAFLTLAMLFVLTACGGTTGETSSTTDSGQGESTTNLDDYGSYTAENPLVFKIAYGDSDEATAAQACQLFAEYVEDQTGGAVQVELYGNGQMGGDEDVIQAILMGNLHLTYCGTSVLCTFDDRFGILDLPYLFTDWDTMDAAVNGDLGAMYQEWAEEFGMYVPGFMWDGMKTVSNSVRPITCIEDMEGLKIRVTNADIFIQTYQAMGANPTPMGWNDIYTGLQQGTVDGMDVPAIPTYTNGFYQAIKYFSLTNNHMSNMCIVMSKSFVDGLPSGIRSVLENGIQEYLVSWDRENARIAEEDAIQKIAESGVQVNEIEPDELQRFVEATAPVYEYYRDLIGDDIMDTVESFRG